MSYEEIEKYERQREIDLYFDPFKYDVDYDSDGGLDGAIAIGGHSTIPVESGTRIYVVTTGTDAVPMKVFRSKGEVEEYKSTLPLDSVCKEFVV
jgi:hypothetical protein